MDLMKKRTVLAITTAVWLAALTSATAVAYAAMRPASWPARATHTDLQTTVECATAPPPSVSEPTLYMPDDVIAGTPTAPAAP